MEELQHACELNGPLVDESQVRCFNSSTSRAFVSAAALLIHREPIGVEEALEIRSAGIRNYW